METLEYLNAVKEKYQLKSDYQLARILELMPSNITAYRKKRRVVDDYVAAKVSELLGIEILELVAQANAEREKDPQKRAYWEAKAKTARENREPLDVLVAELGTESEIAFKHQ